MITRLKAIQQSQNANFIKDFELFLTDQDIAKKEIAINTKSILDHHKGAVSQQVAEQVWTINIKGVAIQWIRHKPLANVPIESELFFRKDLVII